MDPALTPHEALALLAWQVDLGATEAICDAPVNRYEAPRPAPAAAPAAARPVASAPRPPARPAPVDPVAVARAAADAATDREGLAAAMAAYELCELKKGARNLVFSDGNPKARVMVIGEAPGREEDLQGKPFVGRAGHLLDQMFGHIGLGRNDPAAERALYITNVLPWRPPQNRDPEAGEVAMMLPFLERHVALVDPDILVLMGNHSCGALLGRKGITRLRGHWVQALGRPALPMFHPAYLLRTQLAKRDAWHDLLMLQTRLRGG
ncbi:uracil-DNA glycosylase [Rhodovulum sp. YEN HP10]|uniref:uracil-DNA glycosylase n=1 Tax=Rhodovulum sp. HP10 TaxID=3387397 RepID=UPI0039E0B5FB